MSDKKVITINPSIFDPSNFTKKNRGKLPDGKIKMKTQENKSRNKTTKGKLLKYIREKQEEQYKKMFEEAVSKQPETVFDDKPKKQQKLDFNQELGPATELEASVNYLQSIVNDQETKKRKEEEEKKQRNNITMKYQPISDSTFFQSIISEHVDKTDSSSSLPPIMHESFDNIVNRITPDNEYERLKMPVALTTPKYGCLKGGQLPTYRQYMKSNYTQKGPITSQYVSQPVYTPNTSYSSPDFTTKSVPQTLPKLPQSSLPPVPKTPIVPAFSPVSSQSNIIKPEITTVTNPIGSTKEEIKQNERLKNISEIKQLRQLLEKKQKEKSNKSSTMKKKTTKKRTYYLGKSKVHPKVSVLVSNKTIRNQVNKKAIDLKQTPISDVKKYLMQKGFIKVGSTAPHDVLRRMYESAQMIGGEITNYNSDNLLYNYLNA